MFDGINFEKMIFAAITSDLKLWAKPIGCSKSLSLDDRLNDVLLIMLKGQGPLVELASGQHSVSLMHLQK